jgi:hypothetical protein
MAGKSETAPLATGEAATIILDSVKIGRSGNG